MDQSELKTVICIDFGMTYSGAIWRTNRGDRAWNLCWAQKVPTKLARDANKAVVAWGEAVSPIETDIRSRFKRFMLDGDKTSFVDFSDEISNRGQQAREDIRAYLERLCRAVVHQIDLGLASELHTKGGNWKDNLIHWQISVPGCCKRNAVKDFQEDAAVAIEKCFLPEQRSRLRITTDVTEGEASAAYVLCYGLLSQKFELINGAYLLSCDMGGATTDIAIAHTPQDQKLTILHENLPTNAGMVQVDVAFGRYVSNEFVSMGIDKVDALKHSSRLINTKEYTDAKHSFTSDNARGDHVYLSLTLPQDVSDNEDPCLRITYDHFEQFFSLYTSNVQRAIDTAIELHQERHGQVDVIALCGGASCSPYTTQKIRRRQQDKEVTVLSFENTTPGPEFATLFGSSILYDLQEMRNYVAGVAISLKHERGGFRKTVVKETHIPCARSNSPCQWHATFHIDVDTNKVHEIVSVPQQIPGSKKNLPKSFQEACEIPGSKLWTVRVVRVGADRKTFLRIFQKKRPIRLVCKILMIGKYEFFVDPIGGADFDVVVVEESMVAYNHANK